jgi:4-amino-4-deoxychorismate lyase
MFSIDGDVIEGTMSNIFWLKDNQLFTSDLSQEGINGCVRRWVIQRQHEIKPVKIKKGAKLDQLLNSDGVFLTNSLIGIKKVSKIDGLDIAQNLQIDKLAEDFNRQYIRK